VLSVFNCSAVIIKSTHTHRCMKSTVLVVEAWKQSSLLS